MYEQKNAVREYKRLYSVCNLSVTGDHDETGVYHSAGRGRRDFDAVENVPQQIPEFCAYGLAGSMFYPDFYGSAPTSSAVCSSRRRDRKAASVLHAWDMCGRSIANATYMAARPFAILAFFKYGELLPVYEQKNAVREHKRDYILFAIYLLATMTKQFTIVLVGTQGF